MTNITGERYFIWSISIFPLLRYNSYHCEFDLCGDCISKLLTTTDTSLTSHHVSVEDEVPRVRKISRRIYSKSEIGIQTSSENINRTVLETKFAS